MPKGMLLPNKRNQSYIVIFFILKQYVFISIVSVYNFQPTSVYRSGLLVMLAVTGGPCVGGPSSVTMPVHRLTSPSGLQQLCGTYGLPVK